MPSAHALISDILSYIKLPTSLISYISDGYSKLTASVKTKNWKTPMFEIKRGVFQGDTLSPVIFLTVFNPLVKLAGQLATSGFSLRTPVPNSAGLPPVNTAIYVYWDEVSDEPKGWYKESPSRQYNENRVCRQSHGDSQPPQC